MQFYYIHTDYQGSVIAITDADGDFVFQATYDAWGRQTASQNDIAFFRGYTGHEMVEQGCLVNMNGRLYDPCIGRFLSPDNYVQQPTNSQSFNRYSYCLNNPLKYTDPSGEWFFYSALAGFVRGLIKTVSGRAPWYFPLYKTYKNIANDVKVKFGLLKGSPKQILSRFTWELPQTFVGYEYSNYRLVVSDVEKVRYFDGATYVINKSNSTNDGVTIGSYININTTGAIPTDENGKFAPYKSGLFAHEYGHYLQSQKYGWGYLFSHGLPSLYSAMTSEGEENAYSKHNVFWTERDANNKAYDYFLRHGYLLF